MRRLLPDSLTWRFALLLAAALIVANVVAGVLLSSPRQRLEYQSVQPSMLAVLPNP